MVHVRSVSTRDRLRAVQRAVMADRARVRDWAGRILPQRTEVSWIAGAGGRVQTSRVAVRTLSTLCALGGVVESKVWVEGSL